MSTESQHIRISELEEEIEQYKQLIRNNFTSELQQSMRQLQT